MAATDADGTDVRYTALLTGGETIIYDRENPSAWVQSSLAITTDDLQ